MRPQSWLVSLSDVLRRISMMDDKELSQTVRSVLERYSILFPREEVIFISLPKDDPAERRRVLDCVCRLAETVQEK